MSDEIPDVPGDIKNSLTVIDEVLGRFDNSIRSVDDSLKLLDGEILQITKRYGRPMELKKKVSEGEAPKITFVDVVLRDIPGTEHCRPSDKYDGLQFCFVDGNMTRYRYNPSVFKRATGAELEHLQEKINDCPLCKVEVTTEEE